MANETPENWQNKLKAARNASVTFRKGHISFGHSLVCCKNRSVPVIPSIPVQVFSFHTTLQKYPL